MRSTPSDIQTAFKCLADPSRRSMIELLRHDAKSIAELVDHFDISRNAVVKHLRVLEQGKVVKTRVVGRERVNFLHPNALKPAFTWLRPYEQFWDEKLDSLARAVEGISDE